MAVERGDTLYDALIRARTDTVAYWEVDDALGATTVLDSVGGYHGTPSNVTLGSPGPFSTAPEDTALYHDGIAAGGVLMPTSVNIRPAAFTVAAWIYVEASTTGFDDMLIYGGAYGGNVGRGWSIFRSNASGSINFGWRDGTLWAGLGGAASSVAVGAWHHIAASHDGTTGRVYTNGVRRFIQARPYAQALASDQVSILRAGGGANGSLNGRVAKVSMHTGALSDADIAALYAAGAWQRPPACVWNGTTWVYARPRRWTGSTWQPVTPRLRTPSGIWLGAT